MVPIPTAVAICPMVQPAARHSRVPQPTQKKSVIIRRYRKGRPAAGETPSEIEAETAFPKGMDAEGLHERYERARYGRSE